MHNAHTLCFSHLHRRSSSHFCKPCIITRKNMTTLSLKDGVHEDVKKGINLAYTFTQIIQANCSNDGSNCLTNSGKTHRYIRRRSFGFLPSQYNVTSLSFTALTRTSVSSAVNHSWRAHGKSGIIIEIRNGTSAPAFKGNVR